MEAFADGITLLGVPAMVMVPLIVEGLKRLGLPARYAIFASLAVALGVAMLAEVISIWPQTEPAVRVLAGAVVIGFASAGVYSQGKFWSERR